MASIAGLIALVRLQSRSAENSKQLDMLTKDVSRLEKESDIVVRQVAKMEQVEKNISKLWSAHDDMIDKLDKGRDRLEARFTDLRDKLNGHK